MLKVFWLYIWWPDNLYWQCEISYLASYLFDRTYKFTKLFLAIKNFKVENAT